MNLFQVMYGVARHSQNLKCPNNEIVSKLSPKLFPKFVPNLHPIILTKYLSNFIPERHLPRLGGQLRLRHLRAPPRAGAALPAAAASAATAAGTTGASCSDRGRAGAGQAAVNLQLVRVVLG